MSVMAVWCGKTFEVSSKKILTLEKLATSYKLKAETNDDSEGKPSTNVRGLELEQISFETLFDTAVGVDVSAEIESWKSLVGQSGSLIIGSIRFGAEKFKLIDMSVSNIIIDEKGRFKQAKISFKFQEDSEEAAGNKPQNNNSNKLSITPGMINESTYAELGLNNSAVNIGSTQKDKEELKPQDMIVFGPSNVILLQNQKNNGGKF